MTNEEAIHILGALYRKCQYLGMYPKVNEALDLAIKALEERTKGKWVKISENLSQHYECSECRARPLIARLTDEDVLSTFCPSCGAHMRGDT